MRFERTGKGAAKENIGVRVSSLAAKLRHKKRTNVRIYYKKWQTSLAKLGKYVIISPSPNESTEVDEKVFGVEEVKR